MEHFTKENIQTANSTNCRQSMSSVLRRLWMRWYSTPMKLDKIEKPPGFRAKQETHTSHTDGCWEQKIHIDISIFISISLYSYSLYLIFSIFISISLYSYIFINLYIYRDIDMCVCVSFHPIGSVLLRTWTIIHFNVFTQEKWKHTSASTQMIIAGPFFNSKELEMTQGC